jgi:hypothetical protein
MPSLRNRPFLALLTAGGAFAWLESFRHAPSGDPALRPGSTAPLRELSRRLRVVRQDTAYLVFELASWLLVNLLAVLGVAVALFLAISGGDLPTFFLHLDNLTSRYAEADLDRREAFEHQLCQAFLVLLILSLLVRGPLFVASLRRELRNARRNADGSLSDAA